MEALLAVQAAHRDRFGLGLLGDTMQRIYSDGKHDLGRNLPGDWSKPALIINHRCPRRIVQLINNIRSVVDGQEQQSRLDADKGHVRLFISENCKDDKHQIEADVRKRMAAVTGDERWNQPDQVKTLTLEHQMAARRTNFFELFEPLYKIEDFKTGLLDGTLPIVRFFSDLVLPLVRAQHKGNDFAAAAVVRKGSPLLSKKALESVGAGSVSSVGRGQGCCGEALMAL